MRSSVATARACLHMEVPGSLENPRASRLWLAPPVSQLRGRPQTRECVIDFCACVARRGANALVPGIVMSISLDAVACARHGT
eukprot:4197224-Pyramimonas_sp.AAC.1